MLLVEWMFNIAFLLFLIMLIVGNIIRFIMWVKCFRKKECDDQGCHLRCFCGKYQNTITQEDLDCIAELLDERRKELERESDRSSDLRG